MPAVLGMRQPDIPKFVGLPGPRHVNREFRTVVPRRVLDRDPTGGFTTDGMDGRAEHTCERLGSVAHSSGGRRFHFRNGSVDHVIYPLGTFHKLLNDLHPFSPALVLSGIPVATGHHVQVVHRGDPCTTLHKAGRKGRLSVANCAQSNKLLRLASRSSHSHAQRFRRR